MKNQLHERTLNEQTRPRRIFLRWKKAEKKIIYQHTLSCCLYKCHYLLVLKEKQRDDLTSRILRLSSA